MNIGFYYHVGTVLQSGEVAIPSHLGMFVEELARRGGAVTFYGHSGTRDETEDMVLSAPLVRSVDLGPKRSAVARTLRPSSSLKRFDPRKDEVEVMLVRGPTPLLPAFVRASSRVPVVLLIVGDYARWEPSSTRPRLRNALVRLWIAYYARRERSAREHALVLVNSPMLLVGNEGDAKEVFTSSLSETDLARSSDVRAWPTGKGRDEPLRMIYSGRIAAEKGLSDAVDALAVLRDRGWNVHLDVVGHAAEPHIVDALIDQARLHDVGSRLRFIGYRPAGPSLLAAYESADVFVLPSRVDAFPRSLIEALGVGLPVVATRVGSIPWRLEDRKTALLFEAKSSEGLATAVEELISDQDLRQELSREGRAWAATFTNERSCELVVEHLRSVVASSQARPS